MRSEDRHLGKEKKIEIQERFNDNINKMKKRSKNEKKEIAIRIRIKTIRIIRIRITRMRLRKILVEGLKSRRPQKVMGRSL